MKPLHRSGRGGGRVFGHGGLRLVLLQLIADQPRHGYELIKAIEDRLQGQYSPSPGVVYPTLTLLEEMGCIEVAATEGARKQYAITEAGREFLAENRVAADALLARLGAPGAALGERPPQVVRAIENLRLAIRMRLARGPLSSAQAEAIANLLDKTTQDLERL